MKPQHTRLPKGMYNSIPSDRQISARGIQYKAWAQHAS